MSEIKPVYQQRREFDEWEDIPKDTYDMRVNGKYQVRILYPAAAYEGQAKRIAELEEHVTKLGSGSRQHLYQAFARRYKEILSLRRENKALKAENEELRHVNLTSLADLHFKNRELESKNEAQAKRIAELEAATEHLGLTPQQAKDGLARHKAQVAEIESLRKQVEGIAKGIQKHFELSDSDLTLLMSNFENGDSK